MSAQYEIQRVSDGALLRLVKKIFALDSGASMTGTAGDGLPLKVTSGKWFTKEFDRTFSNSTFFIAEMVIKAPSASFELTFKRSKVYRDNPNYANSWSWQSADKPFVDGVMFKGPSGEQEFAIFNAISATVPFSPPGELTKASDTADKVDVIVTRLTDAAATVLEHSAERQLELDAARVSLTEEAAGKINVETERLRKAHDEAMEALRVREKAFEEQAAAFEDRGNTHVRRKLQEAMAKLSTETLSGKLLAKSQQAFLIPAIFALLTILVVAGVVVDETSHLSAFSASLQATIASDTIAANQKPAIIESINQSIFYGQIRLALSTIGAGLLVWFTLRLATNRYRQVSRWEHELHKFRLDTERASFLIEGELEARRLDGNVLPEVVLDRFSRGLFSAGDGDAGRDGDEIGTTLGHLLSRAASLKIGTDGVSVEVDKSGIKKARKDVASDAGSE